MDGHQVSVLALMEVQNFAQKREPRVSVLARGFV
jgi:hypothetical protein